VTRVFDAVSIAYPAIRTRLAASVRYGWARWLLAAVFGAAMLAGLSLAVRLGGLQGTVGDLAVNATASALIALAAIVGFSIGTRRQVLNRLVAYQRRGIDASRVETRPNQARAVVAQLQDNRKAGSLILEAPAGSGRASFVRDLITALADAGVVALHVPEVSIEASVVEAATDEFRKLLVKAGVTEVPLIRTLESLASRRRLAVVIDALDGFDHPTDRRSTVEITAARAAELSAANLPYLATVDPGSTPDELAHCKVTLSSLDHSTISAVAGAGSAPGMPDRGRAERRFAAAVQHTMLESQTVLDQVDARSASAADLDDATRRLTTRGAIWTAIQPLSRAGYTAQTVVTDRTSAGLIGRLARRLVLMDAVQIDFAELLDGMADDDLDGLPTAAARLIALGVIERQYRGGRLIARFADAQVGEVAVGLWLSRQPEPYRISAIRSRTAFVAEAVGRVTHAVGGERAEWTEALRAFAAQGALAAAGDTFAALTAEGVAVPAPASDWLHDVWTTVDVAERIAFVRRLPASVSRPLAAFLWSRLEQPQLRHNPHLLRRTISRYLASSGPDVWEELKVRWSDLILQAEHGTGLAWFERLGTAPWHGSAIASLCWIMPTVASTAAGDPEPGAALRRLTAAVVPGGGPEQDPRPDVGIEISLAEGCKDAGSSAIVNGLVVPPDVWHSIEALATRGRSWISRMLALQAAALAAAADAARCDAARALCAAATRRSEHPLVRRYATILASMLTGPTDALPSATYRYIWPDDTEALDAAGGELIDEAAIVLATTTIVLNLGESRLRTPGDRRKALHSRIRSLVDLNLPTCVDSPLAAFTANATACRCPFQLCGPDLDTNAVVRPISRTFAYRCMSALRSWWRRPWRQSLARGAIRVHLRRVTG
jgi:hypothetical protein